MNSDEQLRLCLASFDVEDFPSIANALAAADGNGWALIAKYGDHPHPGEPGKGRPVLQRFDRPAAEEIVKAYNSTWSRVKRAVTGLPLFNGHPDVPGLQYLYTDREVKGTWAKLEARDDGLWGQPVLTSNGADVVEGGNDRLSPYWWCRIIGKLDDGRPIVSPFRLLSVGLVGKGNIPGPSLMNSVIANQNNPPSMNQERQLLIQILAALGTVVTPQVGDTELANAVQTCIGTLQEKTAAEAKAAPQAAANAALVEVLANVKLATPEGLTAFIANANAAVQTVATANAAVAEKAGVVTTLTTERDDARIELANAKTAEATAAERAKAERKAHATRFANAAVISLKVKAADSAALIDRLCNAADLPAFDVITKEVAKVANVLPGTSVAMGLGNNRSDSTPTPHRSVKIQELVAKRMKDKTEDYPTAYANVEHDAANTDLFSGMKQPDIKLPKSR